ncbi:MAG: hypothetical protein WHS90_13020 [Caldilinea sp.]|uniref:hypothetical protein n=1 Tax=Caldilinea sp. TaxID=2293560 RepID=UPI0030B68CD1
MHRIFLLIGVCAPLAIFFTTRLPITADPRMVLQPWLLNQGFIPYLHIADEHSPLLPHLLAWVQSLVGNDGILALRLAHGTTLTLLFVLVSSWLWMRYGIWAAAAGVAFFWAFAVRFGLTTFWYNLALAPVFFGFFLSLSAFSLERRHLWRVAFSGALVGIGLLFKQQAAILVPVFLIWLGLIFWRLQGDRRSVLRALFLFLTGITTPVLSYIAFYLAIGGNLAALVEWTVLFNLTSGYARLGFLLPTHFDMLAIWPAFLLVVPFVASLAMSDFFSAQERRLRLWLLICALSSLIFLYPRYSPPHWAAAFGFVAAMSAIVSADIVRASAAAPSSAARLFRTFAASLLVFWGIYGAFLSWPGMVGAGQPRLLKFDDPRELAELLKPALPPESTLVFVPDNEAVSNAYYVLQRTPPRFWMMHYPWFMQPHIRERWLAELDKHPPDFVVWIDDLQDLSSTGPEIRPFLFDRYVETSSFVWQGRTVHLLQRKDPG